MNNDKYVLVYKIADRVTGDELPSFSLLFTKMMEHRELTQKKKEKYGKWVYLGKPIKWLYDSILHNHEPLLVVSGLLNGALFLLLLVLAQSIQLSSIQSALLLSSVFGMMFFCSVLDSEINNPVSVIPNNKAYCHSAEFLLFVLNTLKSQNAEISEDQEEEMLVYLLNHYPAALEKLFSYSQKVDKSRLKRLILLNFKNLIQDFLNQVEFDTEYQRVHQNLEDLLVLIHPENEDREKLTQWLDTLKDSHIKTLYQINQEIESVLVSISRDNQTISLHDIDRYFQKQLTGDSQ